jgi:NDP-sugar pyrophosphorylase family protein
MERSKDSQPVKAMLLAAGEGTRLRPLTNNLPKPMVTLGNKPLLGYTLALLARHNIREVAINLHHCPDVVRAYFGDGSAWGVRIMYSFEPELLGTAGAVKKIESFWDGPFLVVYGDNLTDCDLTRFVEFHRAKGGLVTMALFWREDVQQSGVAALDVDDRIMCFVEKPAAGLAPSHWVNAGLMVAEPRVLDYIPAGRSCDFGREVLPDLLARGERVYGYRMTERLWWTDTLADYEALMRQFDEGKIQL